jgi:hypothetical protein
MKWLTCTRLFLLVALVTALATGALAQQGDHIQFTLQGCRNDGSIILPINGLFVCPDSNYTSGELGKGWNELDLVPHRLFTTRGKKSTTPTYVAAIASDYLTNGGYHGYDVISAPVVNAAQSDSSCAVTASAQVIANPGLQGGASQTVYRNLTISQDVSTTCVFDYYERLALGSSQVPGASLQSYIFDQTDLQGHHSDVPINVGVAQGLSKSMTAVQNTDHVWTLVKNPSVAILNFPNTCDATQPVSQPLQISMNWSKLPGDPYNITVTTTVQATNPASRAITMSVTDVIYSGSDQSAPIDALSSGQVTIPPNTANQTVLTHTITVPNGPTAFNDVATGTFTDNDSNVAVSGNVTATASSSVLAGGAEYDTSATISDSESITGAGFLFSADSFSGADGAFSGYVAGVHTAGPVLWNSNSQSDTGSVTFNKTVYVSGPSQSSGSLSDAATLTGSDFLTTGLQVSADATTAVISDARVTLTINAAVDHALAGGSQAFTFHVKDPADNEVATPVIVFGAGDVTGSANVGNLVPGTTYSVSQDPAPGWTTDSSTPTATVTLPSCSGAVSFTNKRAPADLTVSKTAVTSYNRAFNWSILKTVDKTKVKQVSGNVTFNYTIQVNQTGYTDSAWLVTGQITVSNPNDFVDFTGVNVADAIDNGGACTITGGTGVTVPRSGSTVLNYTCSHASAPSALAGINTATASWDSALFATPDSSALGTAAYAFGDPSTTQYKTITVTDTFNNGKPTTLGTLTGVTTSPYTSKKFLRSRTIAVPPTSGSLSPTRGVGPFCVGVSGCNSYTNVATIVETGQTSSVTVQVCGPVPTGSKTMNFWNNSTGQNIIKTGAAPKGVCSSGAWLRQYASFQDLSSTASCTTVASYVSSTINAALVSAASMNARLKGQMLATSLDIYFSDSTLGGNRIAAKSPVGAQAIDTTKICQMNDKSDGTATCSGVFEDVRSAFGGATSPTVLTMLGYAAGQSDVGGLTWYGNIIATQTLAKDAFDAINGVVAFAP